jgi:superfamily II DNA/RNA helicase
MKNFQSLNLSQGLYKSLNKMGYDTPTPIQAQAIPFALDGKDVLGSAQTGTGKTAAFSIPLVNMVMESDNACAIVLTPTRELAKQVLDVVHQLCGYKSNINTAFIIGGESMGKQIGQLKARPRIIVGTPGRVIDHLERGTMKTDNFNFLVLDETDRMLDMGFGVQLDKILTYMPKQRQTLMFSATLPDAIIKMSNKYLNNPERVSMGETNVIATNIEQETMRIEQPEKYDELLTQLHARDGSVIIFIKTKHGADRMAKNLNRDGHEAGALHGDLRQNKRDKVMKNFRSKKFRVLVATDVAARGLDVPHIEHVINYDLPQVAEDYIHRMGRTARAGAKGSALSFIASHDSRKWRAIEALLDPSKAANDFEPKKGRGGKPRRSGKSKPYKGKKPFAKKSDMPKSDKPNKFIKKRTERSAAGKPSKKAQSSLTQK